MQTSVLETHSRETPFEFPHGITAPVLIAQVRNTVSWVLEPEHPTPHFEYYHLCLSAHMGTTPSFVPTDVDSQIRFRLWHPALPDATLLQMADLRARTGVPRLRFETRWNQMALKFASTHGVLS